MSRSRLARPRFALTLFSFAMTAWFAEGSAFAAPAYVRSDLGGPPWGQNTNELAMDMVFGAGEWEDLRFESVDTALLFSPAYQFIYLEGSDQGAVDLQLFLGANQAEVEAWVDAGGTLLLNCGPGEGGDQDWGFGGVTLHAFNYDGSGHASDVEHPIWQGPFLPAATNFTGNSYAHARVSGPGLVPVIENDFGGDPNVAELDWGGGRVLFGGMTVSFYWAPQPDGLDIRANMIAYLAAGDEDEDGFDTFEDNCVAIANPDQSDVDGDDVGDVCDACPDDANDYLDGDGDGVCDNADNCSIDPNPGQQNGDGDVAGDICDACPVDATDYLDSDADGLCDNADGCPFSADPLQTDGDVDGIGDACDQCPIDPFNDIDGDNDCGNVDNCPDNANSNQLDSDGDGLGDACDPCDFDVTNDADGDNRCADNDNCPLDANPSQADVDEDGVGDECDPCSNDIFNDLDHDGFCADVDNCPVATNPDQADVDDDGKGDICDADPNTPPETSSSSDGGDTGDEGTTTSGESSSDDGGPTTLTTSNEESSDDGITSLTTSDESSSTGGDAESSSDDGSTPGESDDGGCSVAGGNRANAGWLALAVLGLMRRRRRV